VHCPRPYQEGGTNYLFYSGSTNWHHIEGPPGRIGVAWSLDGTNFTKYSGNPVFTPSKWWNSTFAYCFHVVKVGPASYRAYYNGIGGGTEAIGLAVATNIFGPWTEVGEGSVVSNALPTITADPMVFPLRDGGWGMVMHSTTLPYNVGEYVVHTAYSADGTNWTAPARITYTNLTGDSVLVAPGYYFEDNGPALLTGQYLARPVNAGDLYVRKNFMTTGAR
jgi:hypothetical protein